MESYTRKQIAESLNMPQRQIHYYTERKVVTPEVEKGGGRGTVNRYSEKNKFEFAILKQLAGYGVAFKAVESIFSLLRHPTIDNARKLDMGGVIGNWKNFKKHTYIFLYQMDDGNFKYEMSFGMSFDKALNEDRMDNSGSVLIINVGRIVEAIKNQ